MGDAALWASLALAAVAVGVVGFVLGRRFPAREKPRQDVVALVLSALAKRSVALDLLPGPANGPGCGPDGGVGGGPDGGVGGGPDGGVGGGPDGRVGSPAGPVAVGEALARCVAVAPTPDGLACELLDSAAEVRPGRAVTCIFAPLRLAGRKVNAFESVILSVDSAAEPPRLTLAVPPEIISLPRRRHARKRVSDPRFVRVRLWLADAATSRLHFPDAAPDIWINAYDGRHGDENAVTDISAGGLALEVRAGLVPPGLASGSPVVVKCSLFQFKEKQFKPYWYAGLVRGVSTPDGAGEKMRRIAIGFTAVGSPDDSGRQGVAWRERAAGDTAVQNPNAGGHP